MFVSSQETACLLLKAKRGGAIAVSRNRYFITAASPGGRKS
jgi:hypothetical protein